MNEGISVIIRNKNEANYLSKLLKILTKHYSEDIGEIIVVDNNSTDNSLEIIKENKCKLLHIDKFTYGKAINLGIEASSYKYCVLLSSHSLPIGNDFFINIIKSFKSFNDAAGFRFCRNKTDLDNFYNSKSAKYDANKVGLLASGCAIRKDVWEKIKFDEKLLAAEDKDWTLKILKLGMDIYLIPSFYIYVYNRNLKQEINKYKIEKTAHYQLFNNTLNSGFLKLLKEIYRALITFLNRLRLVFARFYIDFTFKK